MSFVLNSRNIVIDIRIDFCCVWEGKICHWKSFFFVSNRFLFPVCFWMALIMKSIWMYAKINWIWIWVKLFAWNFLFFIKSSQVKYKYWLIYSIKYLKVISIELSFNGVSLNNHDARLKFISNLIKILLDNSLQ